jgi:hypothetical protein
MINKLPILYKRTKTGAIQQWCIVVEDNAFYTVEGQLDGVLTTSKPTVCAGKNVGKANQTTNQEQALAEAKARHKKKLETGYTENIKNIDNCRTYFEVQLAHKYNDYKDEVKFPAIVQPKIDGCLSGETLIEFDTGEKISIKTVVDNKIIGKIKSYNVLTKKIEYKNILNYMKDFQDINEYNTIWYELELVNGIKIKLTGNHRVYLPDLKCWRRVDSLNGDENLYIT